MNGYVYVLKNATLPNMYKIGGTTKHPESRAKELSNTSVPTPYEVCFFSEVSDWRKAEAFIHESLNEYRVTNNREFFSCPIDMIELQFDKLEKLDNPLNFLIFSTKGGSCSTTVALGLADYYKDKEYSVCVSEPNKEGCSHDTAILSSSFECNSSSPHVRIHVAPSLFGGECARLLNWAVENKARVIIPTRVGKNDLDVLYRDIIDVKKAKINPYVLFSCIQYFPNQARRISEVIIASESIGAKVLPYTIPHSERFNEGFESSSLGGRDEKVSPYRIFNVIFEGIALYFEYEDYESAQV